MTEQLHFTEATNSPGLVITNNYIPSMGEGNGNPLQYSCLEDPMEGGAWWATVHGVAKSRTRLSNFTFTFKSLQMVIAAMKLKDACSLEEKL